MAFAKAGHRRRHFMAVGCSMDLCVRLAQEQHNYYSNPEVTYVLHNV
jgi:hypothetical protein